MRVILTFCCASALAALAGCGPSDAERIAVHQRISRESCISAHASRPLPGTNWEAICTCAAEGEVAGIMKVEDLGLTRRRYDQAMDFCIRSRVGDVPLPSGGPTNTTR